MILKDTSVCSVGTLYSTIVKVSLETFQGFYMKPKELFLPTIDEIGRAKPFANAQPEISPKRANFYAK